MRKLCSYPNCRTVTTDGSHRCAKHAYKSRRSAPVIERAAFYSTTPWRKLSRLTRAERPVCELCQKELTSDLDHWLERSIAGAEEYELDPRNLICLCKSCHYRKGNQIKRLIHNEDYQTLYHKLLSEHPRPHDSHYLHDWISARSKKETQS
jgi:5-methylcytosine-specific restriction endonuclease McrA